MYKIVDINLLKYFLFFMLFIGVINNKIGIISYLIITFFIIILLFFKVKKQIPTIIFIYSFALVLVLYLSYIYQQLYYNHNNIYFIQFFGSQLLFFYLFSLFMNVNLFIQKYMSKFLYISLLMMGLVMLYDTIVFNIGMPTQQLMYRPELAFGSYISKPLGLFGQFSVNTTYAVVFFMLYLSFQNIKKSRVNIFLFLIVTFIIVISDSGTGYIAYFLMLLTIFYRNVLIRYFLYPSFFVVAIFVVKSNLITKVSYEYFKYNYEYFYNIMYIIYFQHIHSISDLLFGIDGNYNFPIDFGPLFMIAKIGFMYFILYSIVLFYVIYKAPDKYFKIAILILIVANLHYPALFYPIMNTLIPLLLIYIIKLKKDNLTYFNKKILVLDRSL